jgi:hypothetical protein
MLKRFSSALLLVLALVHAPMAANCEAVGDVVSVTGMYLDTSGKEVSPIIDRKATVLLFIATTCPISNSYAPEISRLSKTFYGSGIRTYCVLTDNDLTLSAASEYRTEYRLACPVLLDPHHSLVAATGAAVTPEAIVIDRHQRMVYRGRIDNRFVDFGVARLSATTSDLESIIERIAKGEVVRPTQTKAIGCFIPPPDQ